MNYHSELAKENEIQSDVISQKIKLGFIRSLDFMSILTNLLNNTNEACLRVQQDQRWLRIEMSLETTEKLSIKVVNSKNSNFGFEKNGENIKREL